MNILKLKEKKYGTHGTNHFIYHRVVEQDGGLGLKFPAFLIGIEKAYRKEIRFNDIDEKLCENEFLDDEDLKIMKKILNDPKRTFVSHMVEYSLSEDCIKEDIFYNAYEKGYDPKTNPKGAYLRGLEALDELRKRIENNINNGSRYTHIILYSMGWNTDQQESLRNYNSLISLMMKERKGSVFKPLFIGISWPSELKMRGIFKVAFWVIGLVFEGIYKYGIGYKVKANDADEVGIIWVNKMLWDILIPAKKEKNIPLILMGHSFGARIITRAVFSKGQIVYGNNKVPKNDRNVVADNSQKHPIDLIIGLQGAFSVNRFNPKDAFQGATFFRKVFSLYFFYCIFGKRKESWEGAPYRKYSEYVKKCIFTWSRHDTANTKAFWSDHIGGEKGYERSLKHEDIFDHFKIKIKEDSNSYDVKFESVEKENGTQSNEWKDSFSKPNKISIVNASDLIKNESYDKGGKAHSDIYTPGVANFVWDCINNL